LIDVVRDREGVRMALEVLFEEDFARALLDRRSPNASDRERARMESAIPARVLSPGYFRWAEHLLRLDAEREAGIPLDAAKLTAYETDGLLDVKRMRQEFQHRHPACGSCGERLESRLQPECHQCHAKFRRN